VRKLAAALEAAAMGLFIALAGVQAAAAATSWLTVSDGYASFRIPAEYVQRTMGDASLLVVDGNFGPSFNRSEFGLTRFGDAWTGSIGPLPPGLYHYQITADDTKVIKDPTNPTSVASEPAWSTFLVPGDAARLLIDVPPGHGGTLGTITYRAGGPDRERSATVWTPPGYDGRRAEPYPVLYLLDGEGGSHTDWADLGRARQILDNLAVLGRAKPMIVVMGGGNEPDFRNELNSIVRAARRHYNVAHDPAHQALAGPSTGGSHALRTALAQPGAFASIGSFAGVLTDEAHRVDANAVNARTRLLRLYTGNLTDPAYNPTYRLMRAFNKAHVRYEFDGVNVAVGHNWTAWQEDLADFVPRLFNGVRDHGRGPGHQPLTREFTPPAPGTTPTPWLTRDANGNTFATVETGTEFADARHVTLWGNWAPGGSWLRIPLSRQGDRWRGTVGPLKPGFYYCQFIVDLAAKKDTANPTSVTSEPTWSTFLVPGRSARLLADVPAGRGGRVGRLIYTSSVAGEERTAYVWTPPGYRSHRAAPYPVLYLQHGSGQSYTDWVEMGRAEQILDNESLAGKIQPMVVVMGNGNVPDFTTELLENIVPAARANYNIAHDPARQALAGLSMGGVQTYAVLKAHPGEFAYVGTFSAWFADPSGADVTAINNGTTMLRIYTGDVTDFVYPFVRSTLATLDSMGVRYEFAGVTPRPHGWDTWQKNLIDFAPRLFRHDAR
jgi:enterochelin esterase-like enzyme